MILLKNVVQQFTDFIFIMIPLSGTWCQHSALKMKMMTTMTTMSDGRRQRRRETTMSDEWKPKIIISIVQLLGSSKFKSFFTKLNWVSSTKECACWISAFYVLESDLREIFVFFMKEKEWKFEFSKFTKFVLRIFSLLELNWWRVVFSGSESWTSRLFSKMKILMLKFEFQELLYVDWMRYNLLWITEMRLFSFVCCFLCYVFGFLGYFLCYLNVYIASIKLSIFHAFRENYVWCLAHKIPKP